MKPAFVGVGVPKSATSWIFKRLSEHPGLFTPAKKEIGFFNHPGRLAEYLEHFKDCPPGKLAGEYTPNYILNPQAIQRIRRQLPHAKLLVSLRHPVDRAWSQWKMDWYFNRVPRDLSFYRAWQRFQHLSTPGRYPHLLKRLCKHFPLNQVLVLFYQDIAVDPWLFMNRVFSFLGVESPVTLPRYGPHLTAYGTETSHLTLSPQDRQRLTDFYRPSILRLQNMVGRDLSSWLG